MLYNKRDTVFHKTAARLKVSAAHILTSLSTLPPLNTGDHSFKAPFEGGSIGDLEGDPETLKLLLSEDIIRNDIPFVIDAEPITSLFRFERERLKPPPPPPPPPPPKPPKAKKERPKRDYKMERERRKQVQAAHAAENAMLLDSSPGFRAPRATRSTKAALAALEAEIAAGSTQSPSMDGSASGGVEKLDAALSSQAVTVSGSETAEVVIHPERPSIFPRPRSWRREHVMLPGQGGPNMVESMDDQGSFKNFDRGWILPSGSRRHGRAVPEPQPIRDLLPPPKKRARTGKWTRWRL